MGNYKRFWTVRVFPDITTWSMSSFDVVNQVSGSVKDFQIFHGLQKSSNFLFFRVFLGPNLSPSPKSIFWCCLGHTRCISLNKLLFEVGKWQSFNQNKWSGSEKCQGNFSSRPSFFVLTIYCKQHLVPRIEISTTNKAIRTDQRYISVGLLRMFFRVKTVFIVQLRR